MDARRKTEVSQSARGPQAKVFIVSEHPEYQKLNSIFDFLLDVL